MEFSNFKVDGEQGAPTGRSRGTHHVPMYVAQHLYLVEQHLKRIEKCDVRNDVCKT